MQNTIVFETVEQYIAAFPATVRHMLMEIRQTVKKAAPEAVELIAYNMPAYRFHGPLVYFAGYAGHVGFYPTPSAIEAFKKETSIYKSAKGSVQFPLDKPLPLKLVTEMVKFRVEENLTKARARKKKK